MGDVYVDAVNQAATYITAEIHNDSFVPRVAITLGSGMAKLATLIRPIASIPYKNIPHFPRTTVPGHEGTLIAGYIEGIPVIGLNGRKHYYEVANESTAMDQVTFPVQVMASLGCTMYVATNAAGGLNPQFHVGDLMVISSHIGMFIPNPLLGPAHDFGNNDYFQPLHDIYPKILRDAFKAGSPGIQEGVYACLTGRTFETNAECVALRTLGADAVGMSTVPEIIVARNRGMKTLAVSTITNVITNDGTNATNHEEVVAVLNSAETETKLFNAYRSFFAQLPE